MSRAVNSRHLGILSYESPKSLQNMVFFYIGLHLCLRGVQEQHDLKPEQLCLYPTNVEVYNEDSYYQYTELISKNNLHRFKDIHMKNKTVKTVTVHAIVGSQKCLLKMIDFYLSKLPENPNAFYLMPQKDLPSDEATFWYINVPTL